MKFKKIQIQIVTRSTLYVCFTETVKPLKKLHSSAFVVGTRKQAYYILCQHMSFEGIYKSDSKHIA